MEALIAWFAEIHWVAVLQIILIDILLGGDNAVVIALACRNLDPSLRFKGVLYGAAGAILLRVILIAFAVTIMNIPFLKLVGALLLLWIGIKLIVPQDEGEHEIHASKRLWGAIKTIIVADLVMSLDNVIAIAGAAEQAPAGHQMALVIFGLLVSVPFILGGSQLFLKVIDRYPDHCLRRRRFARLDRRHIDCGRPRADTVRSELGRNAYTCRNCRCRLRTDCRLCD